MQRQCCESPVIARKSVGRCITVGKIIRIETPLTKEAAKQLKAGDAVYINGIVYAARDAAHKMLIALLNDGKELPFNVRDQIIYYVGPCPA
jgi:fumarate hydratase subunit beta